MNLMLVNVRCKKAVTLLSGERKLIQRQNLKIFLRKSIFFYINAGVIKLTFTFNILNLVRVSSIVFPCRSGNQKFVHNVRFRRLPNQLCAAQISVNIPKRDAAC